MGLAKFCYRPEKKVGKIKNKKNPCIFWQLVGTYCWNMTISEQINVEECELAPWDTYHDSEYIFSNPILLAAKNPKEIMYSGKTNKLLSSSTSLLRCSQAIWHIAEFCSDFFPSSSWLMGWLTGCCVQQQQQQFVNKSRPEQTFVSWHNNFVHVHYITIATRLSLFYQ